ncbi:carboxymuconolactone decarboxylase family protein [Streptomyces sp. 303MFCol5.2]|uniref:carboxymuconolactone decarboxylase family protein n=1 Tax=Streptomyces sp. 303MFCol5.2 TaxID=1172181 RepID=UPI00131F36DF|nr:carboxymuconolactone decarboxylase family protein [Streptomyces sp. 303MFCol5.2]
MPGRGRRGARARRRPAAAPGRPTRGRRRRRRPVWEHEGLSKRDRSLVTIASLTALGKRDQLQFHLAFARQNGVTDEEGQEALLHLAFYSGRPNGTGATSVLKNIVEQQD